MQDNELYEQLLGLNKPWKMSSVDLRIEESKVTVTVTHELSPRSVCPAFGLPRPVCDLRHPHSWHVDTCGLATMAAAELPRFSWKKHGVRQVRGPWAAGGIEFTALFEMTVISWLQSESINALPQRRDSNQLSHRRPFGQDSGRGPCCLASHGAPGRQESTVESQE